MGILKEKQKFRPQIKQIVDKLPLEKFIPVAFLVFLLLFIILTIITYNSINSYRQNVEQVNHTQVVLNEIDAINFSLTQMQLNRRAYVVKNDSKDLADYYNNRNGVSGRIKKLRELVSDNPVQLGFVNKIDTLSERSMVLLDSSIALYEMEKNISSPAQREIVTISQEYLDKAYIASNEAKNEEIRLLNMRQRSADTNLSETQWFIIGTSLFVFIVLGLSLFISGGLIRNKNRAEKLLKKSYDELEDKVEERTSELKSSNENLVSEIKNRERIEKSLRESEGRFRQMADSAPVLIWMSDKEKLATYFNQGWTDFTGRNMLEDLGNGWLENIHADDKQRYLDVYNIAFDNREIYELEYRLKTSAGDYRWILEKGVPRYEGNEFIGYIGSGSDIHSKKRTERYLRIQYTVSKSLTESKTIDEAVTRIIENICQELQWDFGIIWLRSGKKLVQGALWSKEQHYTEDYSEIYDKTYTFEKGIGIPGSVWKENRSRWIENIETGDNVVRKEGLLKIGLRSALAFPIEGNELIGVVECFSASRFTPKEDLLEVLETVGRQIGSYIERKRVEEQLKESYDELENRVKERTVELANTLNKLLKEIEIKETLQNKLKLFAHAIKGVRECIYITDLNGNTLFVNSAFESIYGYHEGELIGRQIPMLYDGNITPELRDDILTQSVRGGWKGELKNKRKDGSDVDIYLSSSAIRNDEGKIEAYVGICQDITESLEQKQLMIKRNALLKLYNDVIIVTNRSFNVEASVSYAINKMCEYTDWEVGHCYLIEEGMLVSTKLWNANLSSTYLKFKELTEKSVFLKGEGIPGMTYENNESYWKKIKDINEASTYKRSEEALNAGLRTGVWAPIRKGSKVVGVLEFFNSKEIKPDNEILGSINNIGIELGSLIERNEIINRITESEENLRLLVETVKDYAIIRLDKDGHISSWNKGAQEIKGYTADEIIGRHFSIFYTDDEINENEPEVNLTNAVKFGRFEREGWRVKKDGSLFWADIIFNPIYNTDAELVGYVKVTRDMTERRKNEENLRESERQLKEAQSIAHLGNWEWDVKTNEVKWSDEMFAIYELNPDEYKPTLEGFLSKLHPDDIEEIKSYLESSLKNGAPFEFYERILTPTGEMKILKSQGGVRRDSNGDVTKLVGTCLDVTEMRRAEEAIIQSERQLKEAQKIAKLGSWEWDALTDKVRWSEEMYNIFEIDDSIEITNEKYLKLLDEDSKKIRSEAIAKAIEDKKPFNYYLTIRTPRGKTKILNSLGEIKTDDSGNVTRMVGTIIDVTDIKKAEQKITQSEKQLKDAQQIAKLGSWEVNLLNGKTSWSEEMYRLFEVDKMFELTDTDLFKSFIHEDDKHLIDKLTSDFTTGRQEDMEITYRVITKHGRLKYITSDIRVEYSEGSKPIRIYGSSQDITDLKLAEEELRKANAMLIEAQKELLHSEKLAALGRFSSGIAHEIRNPLANISALAQLLNKSDIKDEKMKKHLKYILVNTDIANNIIKDLLHFASPEDLVFKEENLNVILENLVDSVEPRCQENNIKLTKSIHINKETVSLDKTRLENALLNFMSNAIDAMKEQGGSLIVNAKSDNINNEVVIDVIDTGEGIPKENLDKIFEPFFTTKETGTGLGLGLAYQTVKLHRGTLHITSEPGKGTHVEVRIPLSNFITST